MAILPGSRIRDNGVFGTITDNPLTAGSTTFNSARLADLPVVAGNHAIITLDPLREFGEPEIVMVTAHTASATVATITRGMFGTTARSHPQNTLWVHAATQDDYTEVVTSGTRPTDQYRGERIYESDTNRLVAYSSANAWQQEGLFFDPPACRVFGISQSIPNNVNVALAFNSERYDTDGMHDTAVLNSRITINTAGLYLVTMSVQWAPSGSASVRLHRIRINGTTDIAVERMDGRTGTIAAALATTYKFAVGDYVEAVVIQLTGAALNIDAVGNSSPEFSATWIGRGN